MKQNKKRLLPKMEEKTFQSIPPPGKCITFMGLINGIERKAKEEVFREHLLQE
jgi:hypothetical protein